MPVEDNPSHPTRVIPPQPTIAKPGHLSKEQVEQFFKEGYVIVKDYFTHEELKPSQDAIAGMVDELAQKLYKAGKIKNLHENEGLFQRLTKLDEEWPGAFVLFFKMGKFHQSFGTLWTNERILNMMEQLIGPEIAGHPVWNLRPKVPNNEGTVVPWHQDAGYFSADSYEHLVVTAWIPFLNTHANNGGMQVVKGVHGRGCARHTCAPGDTWYIDLSEDDIRNTLGADLKNDIITCDVPYGGFLLFNQLTPHRSLPNISNDVRWSMDLRWQSPNDIYGFYDIQDGILFRDPKQPNLQPDWEKFLSVNRKEVWQKKFYKETPSKTDEFNTIVTGPWLGRWDITHSNKHTDAFQHLAK
ncbi:unnamed protein product [Owenia fusiformis]|uniref:Phytanoyl-CoA dioxygenase family protein n=1 Tax=Owenia fusiformis TaxID=6347 RepID=A0A8S4NHT3_OWEFU|nr:unnamed protein product [Owenia fusiformis]